MSTVPNDIGPDRSTTPATGGVISTPAATTAVPPIDAPMRTIEVAPSDRRNAAAATTSSSAPVVVVSDTPKPLKSNASTRYPRSASFLATGIQLHIVPSTW